MEPDLPIDMTTTTITLSFGDFWNMGTELQAARNDRAALTDENHTLAARIADLEKQLADALKSPIITPPPVVVPPVVVPPVVVPPVVVPPTKITRTSLPRFAGFTVEKSKVSPSATLYSQVKTALRWGRVQGLDTWRGFFNPQEVIDHQKPAPPLGNLPEYGRSLGYTHWIADTIDRILELIPFDTKDPSDAKLKAYMDGLDAMGAEGVYINDANRKSTPDHPGITFDQLKAMIARLRHVAPDMPIFVSLLGSADVALYETLGVWVELQTFGTVAELTGTFLKKKAIMCLSLFKSMTAPELKTRADATLLMPPKWFFFYADEVTDYDAMPDAEDAVIREFVAAWKKIA